MGKALDATIWAGKLYGPDITFFSFLRVGNRFRFPAGGRYTKTSTNGWFVDDDTGHKFRTSGTSAVFRLGADPV